MRAISSERERLSNPVTGSMILGAELPVTITGPSSGIVLSYFGSRPLKVKPGGISARKLLYDRAREPYPLIFHPASVTDENFAGFIIPYDEADVFQNLKGGLMCTLDLLVSE